MTPSEAFFSSAQRAILHRPILHRLSRTALGFKVRNYSKKQATNPFRIRGLINNIEQVTLSHKPVEKPVENYAVVYALPAPRFTAACAAAKRAIGTR